MRTTEPGRGAAVCAADAAPRAHGKARSEPGGRQARRGAAARGRGAIAWLAVVAVCVVVLFPCFDGTASASGPPRRPGRSAADLAADVVRALTEYRGALARGLPVEEAAATEAREAFDERRDLQAAGVLSMDYVEAARRQWEAAERNVADTRTAIDEVDHMLAEASLQNELRRLPALSTGGYQETPTLVRFNGGAPWSLRDVPALSVAFERSFGRRLPISAFGQTALHTRLGFDHQNAIDVAVHPDSAEGQWLMNHLRAAGIPFIAARNAMAGSSTGAHVHIGRASGRAAAR